MATQILIQLNGQDWFIKPDNFSFKVIGPGSDKPIAYPSKLGRALHIIVRESSVDPKSDEVLNLEQFVERYEDAKKNVLAIQFPTELKLEAKPKKAKKQAEDFEF